MSGAFAEDAPVSFAVYGQATGEGYGSEKANWKTKANMREGAVQSQ